MFENSELSTVNKIIVNTDCLFAIDKLKNPYEKWGSSKNKKIVKESNLVRLHFKKMFNDYFSEKPKKRKIIIDYRHVKAHDNTDSARNYVNDMLDRECKVQMGVLLKNIKTKKEWQNIQLK